MDEIAAKTTARSLPRPIGIFQIRNIANNKIFVGSSFDLRAIFNRIRFQLYGGVHPARELCSDWRLFGTTKFEFEVLEVLAQDLADHDYSADLEALEDLWLEKLKPFDEAGYNVKKPDDRLRLISERMSQG